MEVRTEDGGVGHDAVVGCWECGGEGEGVPGEGEVGCFVGDCAAGLEEGKGGGRRGGMRRRREGVRRPGRSGKGCLRTC